MVRAVRDSQLRNVHHFRNVPCAWFRSLLLVALCWASRSDAATIVVDSRNSDLAIGVDYELFRATILGAGHTIVSRSLFTSAELLGADALILRQPRYIVGNYTSQETAAIREFVFRGGGLLVIGEGGRETDFTVNNVNGLVSPFGLGFGAVLAYSGGGVISGFNSHPVTEGIKTVGVDFVRSLSTISGSAVDLTVGSDVDNILAQSRARTARGMWWRSATLPRGWIRF